MPFGGKRAAILGGALPQFTTIAALPGLEAWYEANDTATIFQDDALTTPATLDNDPIGGWTDKSGQANHVLQTVAGNKPLLNAAAHNGRHAITFDGADDYLAVSVFADGSAAQSYTVSAVATMTANVAIGWFWAGGSQLAYVGHAAGTATAEAYAGAATAFSPAYSFTSTLTIYSVTFVNGIATLYVNGARRGTASVSTGPVNGVTIGNRLTAASPWAGDIAELIFCDATLHANVIAGLHRYLGGRYGITVS